MKPQAHLAWWWAVLALVGALAACQSNPKDPKTWVAKLNNDDPQVVADALDHLRQLDAKSALGPVEAALKSDDMGVRSEAAQALQAFGEKSAVKPLAAAVDIYSSASGADDANIHIAQALGALGDKAALPALTKMVEAARPLVRVAAVEALGKLGDPSSVEPLIRLVEDQSTPPLITKEAIIALGAMRAAPAVRALEEALVMERMGISFFPEASYALFQIGQPAAVALLKILNGEDKPYLKWADDNNRAAAGYLSKAAIIEADLDYTAAVPQIVKLMQWNDPNGDPGKTLLLRGEVASALGRLRATAAARPIAGQVNVEEANIRHQYAFALARIGDESVIPKLVDAAKNKTDTWGAREEAIEGLALLGGAREKPVLDALLKEETPDAAFKECMAEDTNESADVQKAHCQEAGKARQAFLTEELAVLLTGDECKKDPKCWIGKLADKREHVRERAAYTLGELGAPEAVDPLVVACKDKSLAVRHAAYIALAWLSYVPATKSELKAKAAALSAQYVAEKGHALTQIVNEDLKRDVWRLDHL